MSERLRIQCTACHKEIGDIAAYSDDGQFCPECCETETGVDKKDSCQACGLPPYDWAKISNELATLRWQNGEDGQTIARLKRELSDVKAENEKYKAMLGQAYRIEFTDRERVIEKYGADSIADSSTGIVWIVQDESDQKLSRHETALEAFESITAQADSAA